MGTNGSFNPNTQLQPSKGQKRPPEEVVVKRKMSGKAKLIIVVVAIVLFIVLSGIAQKRQKAKEQAAVDALNSRADVTGFDAQGNPVVQEPEQEQLSEAELKQRALIEVFGEPPAGFRWSDNGTPVPISDEGLTDEEVAFQYMRALSMLDMETAQKYAYISTVIPTYDGYFGVDASQSYYTQFVRKLFTDALLSLQIDSMDNKAIFASGRRTCTFTVEVLDLSYKDFWLEDREEFFSELEVYLSYEKDSTKGEQFVYDKILEYFGSPDAKTKTVQIDIVLDKVTKGGWLITDDTELKMLCQYTNGTSVYQYIMEQYADWVTEKYKQQY